jgi:hypothetical protein
MRDGEAAASSRAIWVVEIENVFATPQPGEKNTWMYCLELLASTNASESNDKTMRMLSSKSRPPWRKRSHVQRCWVKGMVARETAVKMSRTRPIAARARAVHEQELRFGRRVPEKQSNSPSLTNRRCGRCKDKHRLYSR